ncbi:MAG: hypothetical protein GY867_06430 [bacterium]|nr:hypothetical protein [bacterium]
MKKDGRIGQRLLLFSLAALIPPMTAFPAQFGTQLARFSAIGLLYELVFYGIVVYAFQRRGGLLQLVPAAAACLAYRLALGLALGLMMTIAYGLDFKISAMMGAVSYLPGVLFLTALTPFIMMPVAALFYRNFDRPRPQPVKEPEVTAAAPKEGRTSIAISLERGVVDKKPAPRPIPETPKTAAVESAPSAATSEVDGFERAVRYLGEHGSVYMAAIVDHEGLTLANFVRGEANAEEWAPLALLFFRQNEEVLGRGNLESPEKLDLVLKEKRIKVAREGNLSLMVVSERHADDVLGIRVNQALEMVKKHMSERYSHMLDPNAERIHVSSTQ